MDIAVSNKLFFISNNVCAAEENRFLPISSNLPTLLYKMIDIPNSQRQPEFLRMWTIFFPEP